MCLVLTRQTLRPPSIRSSHRRPDLAVPLALHVLPFREEVSRRMVKKIAKENALFALATAVARHHSIHFPALGDG